MTYRNPSRTPQLYDIVLCDFCSVVSGVTDGKCPTCRANTKDAPSLLGRIFIDGKPFALWSDADWETVDRIQCHEAFAVASLMLTPDALARWIDFAVNEADNPRGSVQ